MPNRIIKESLFDSEKISQLNDFEFRLWVGLITQADDAGRGDARPAILKGHLFSLRSNISLNSIQTALINIDKIGAIVLYAVDGQPYYLFPNWEKHQRVRNYKPKYPGLDNAEAVGIDVWRPMAANGGQRRPNTIQYNTIQYNTIHKEINKESEDVLKAYTQDEEILGLLHDWLDVRKSKRAKNTKRAIELNISRLDRFASESGLSVKEYLEEIIRREWQTFYPIEQRNAKKAKEPNCNERVTTSNDYSEMRELLNSIKGE